MRNLILTEMLISFSPHQLGRRVALIRRMHYSKFVVFNGKLQKLSDFALVVGVFVFQADTEPRRRFLPPAL